MKRWKLLHTMERIRAFEQQAIKAAEKQVGARRHSSFDRPGGGRWPGL